MPEDLAADVADAMSDIRVVLSGVAPAERAAFWHAVDLLYRAPSEAPTSTTASWPIQRGFALGLERLLPPVPRDESNSDHHSERLAPAAAQDQTFKTCNR
jgi:hypothetical protein